MKVIKLETEGSCVIVSSLTPLEVKNVKLVSRDITVEDVKKIVTMMSNKLHINLIRRTCGAYMERKFSQVDNLLDTELYRIAEFINEL